MKRFGGSGHYLHSQAQSEQAAAFKTLCLAVCSHWLVIDGWGALLGELCSLPVSSASPDRHSFHYANSIQIPRRGPELLPAVTIHKVRGKCEEREVENRICQDSDAQKPAKRPSKGPTGFRGDEFGQLQAWRKKTNHGGDNLRFDGHGDGQREKTSDETEPREQKETEKLALRHRCRL